MEKGKSGTAPGSSNPPQGEDAGWAVENRTVLGLRRYDASVGARALGFVAVAWVVTLSSCERTLEPAATIEAAVDTFTDGEVSFLYPEEWVVAFDLRRGGKPTGTFLDMCGPGSFWLYLRRDPRSGAMILACPMRGRSPPIPMPTFEELRAMVDEMLTIFFGKSARASAIRPLEHHEMDGLAGVMMEVTGEDLGAVGSPTPRPDQRDLPPVLPTSLVRWYWATGGVGFYGIVCVTGPDGAPETLAGCDGIVSSFSTA